VVTQIPEEDIGKLVPDRRHEALELYGKNVQIQRRIGKT
jgi:hypothetical protein